jgi:hypothetical protein
VLPWIAATIVGCFVLERCAPGWRLPPVHTWPARVFSISAVQLGVVVLAGLTWERWLAGPSLVGLSARLSPCAAGFAAHFVAFRDVHREDPRQ